MTSEEALWRPWLGLWSELLPIMTAPLLQSADLLQSTLTQSFHETSFLLFFCPGPLLIVSTLHYTLHTRPSNAQLLQKTIVNLCNWKNQWKRLHNIELNHRPLFVFVKQINSLRWAVQEENFSKNDYGRGPQNVYDWRLLESEDAGQFSPQKLPNNWCFVRMSALQTNRRGGHTQVK